MKRAWRGRGFTLVELLVVITIIGILIALLLPAVQAAREAARRLQCQNHIKQLALGCLTHENTARQFPTGGWGYAWTGDADRGTDWQQPGGWLYNILPFIEQQPLYDLGSGMDAATKKTAHKQRLATPVSYFYCPTRRPVATYPWTIWHQWRNSDNVTVVGRNDYAANSGDNHMNADYGPQDGPASMAVVSSPRFFADYNASETGVIFYGSTIKMADVTDGTSNTYLLGEKYADPDYYTTGEDNGDNEAALSGDNEDITRWTDVAPLPDTPGYAPRGIFGSAHATGFSMAFCDGSVQQMNYTIDPTIHKYLGNRGDDHPINPKNL
jgi:prepilin-type N-terminal cleavage/methylation domain-containing protein